MTAVDAPSPSDHCRDASPATQPRPPAAIWQPAQRWSRRSRGGCHSRGGCQSRLAADAALLAPVAGSASLVAAGDKPWLPWSVIVYFAVSMSKSRLSKLSIDKRIIQ